MAPELSPRLARIVAALPVTPRSRVIEVGCGPGAAARAVAAVLTDGGTLLAVDRSAAALAQLERTGADLIEAGRLRTRQVAVEDLLLEPGEERYDLAFANRVGALDGRHPALRPRAMARLREALTPDGRLFVDGTEVPLHEPPG